MTLELINATELDGHTSATGANARGGPQSGGASQVRNPRDARQARIAQAFAQVVAVMMHDTNFKNVPLGDLEWLVLPPLLAGQFKLGHAQALPEGADGKAGIVIPVSVALWARVSPAIDKGLQEHLDRQVRLRPTDWATGDNIWLMAAAGDRRALPSLFKQLQETEFKGQQVKLRERGADGQVVIKLLSDLISTDAQRANINVHG